MSPHRARGRLSILEAKGTNEIVAAAAVSPLPGRLPLFTLQSSLSSPVAVVVYLSVLRTVSPSPRRSRRAKRETPTPRARWNDGRTDADGQKRRGRRAIVPLKGPASQRAGERSSRYLVLRVRVRLLIIRRCFSLTPRRGRDAGRRAGTAMSPTCMTSSLPLHMITK